MQPPQNPYEQPAYNQSPYPSSPGYGPPPQAPRGTVSLDVISEAWSYLSSNIGQWILAIVIYFAVLYGIAAVRGIFDMLGQKGGSSLWSVLAIIIQIISWCAQQLLLAGLIKMAIDTVRTRVANISEMWSIANVALNVLLSALLQTLLYAVVCLPGMIVLGLSVIVPLMKSGVFSPAVLATGKPPAIPPALLSSMIGGISLGVLLLFAALIPMAAFLFLTVPLIVDRKLGPWQAITQSAGALKRHFGASLVLLFVLGLINIGGVLACCVGLLFTIPLTQLAVALVYRDLFDSGETTPPATIYAPPPIAHPDF